MKKMRARVSYRDVTSLNGARIMIRYLRLILAVPLFLLAVGCSTNPTVANGGDPELVAKGRQALQDLFVKSPKAKEIAVQSKGVLVFPDVVKAGFLVGAQGGKGIMFSPDGKVLGYYRARGVSYGLQAGAQSYSEAMFFTTDAAMVAVSSNTGLSVGMGPSVVVVDAGMARSMTTTTLQSDVYAFIFGQEGLMAGLGVQGQRIVKFDE
jgi:lipid-binding SYLF domain-containing protein